MCAVIDGCYFYVDRFLVVGAAGPKLEHIVMVDLEGVLQNASGRGDHVEELDGEDLDRKEATCGGSCSAECLQRSSSSQNCLLPA